MAYLLSDSSRSGVVMKVGSDDQSRLYLNGKRIYQSTGIRAFQLDQVEVRGLELKTGLNTVVFKVVNEGGTWEGSIRFMDENGRPLPGLTLTLDPAH